jgi:AcrR family transcriptional regulator
VTPRGGARGKGGVAAGPADAPTRSRFAPDVRRGMIVDAARRHLVERGLAATSAREVAKAAGVSIGTLTYHFATMDELLTEVLESTMRQFEEVIDEQLAEEESPSAALELLMNAYFGKASVDVGLLWIEFWTRSVRVPALRGTEQTFRWSLHSRIVRLLEQGADAGEFELTEEPEAIGTELVALIDGLMIAVKGGAMTGREARRILQRRLSSFLAPPPQSSHE